MSKRTKVIMILVASAVGVAAVIVTTVNSVRSGIQQSAARTLAVAESPYKILKAETRPGPSWEAVEKVLASEAVRSEQIMAEKAVGTTTGKCGTIVSGGALDAKNAGSFCRDWVTSSFAKHITELRTSSQELNILVDGKMANTMKADPLETYKAISVFLVGWHRQLSSTDRRLAAHAVVYVEGPDYDTITRAKWSAVLRKADATLYYP